jgi:hypothetical protein
MLDTESTRGLGAAGRSLRLKTTDPAVNRLFRNRGSITFHNPMDLHGLLGDSFILFLHPFENKGYKNHKRPSGARYGGSLANLEHIKKSGEMWAYHNRRYNPLLESQRA